jgi:hypothetical protein
MHVVTPSPCHFLRVFRIDGLRGIHGLCRRLRRGDLARQSSRRLFLKDHRIIAIVRFDNCQRRARDVRLAKSRFNGLPPLGSKA